MWQHPPAKIFLCFERSFPPRYVHSIPNMLSTKPSMPTDRPDMRRPLTIWMLPDGETQCRCQEKNAAPLDGSCYKGFFKINSWLPTLHRPEHRVVVAVADSGWVRETRSPQAGPVPGHLDDGGAPHSTNWGDLPALHGHGAGGEDPAQNRQQEGPNLNHPNLHLEGWTWILDNSQLNPLMSQAKGRLHPGVKPLCF